MMDPTVARMFIEVSFDFCLGVSTHVALRDKTTLYDISVWSDPYMTVLVCKTGRSPEVSSKMCKMASTARSPPQKHSRHSDYESDGAGVRTIPADRDNSDFMFAGHQDSPSTFRCSRH